MNSLCSSKVLVACEYSGTVRDAFIARGHDAMSCDLLPTDKPGPHYQGDVLKILDGMYWCDCGHQFEVSLGKYGCPNCLGESDAQFHHWDIMIAHPPCTYLAVSGLHWNKRIPGRAEKTEQALEFVWALMNAPIHKIAIENPVSCISSRIRKPDQIVQPWWFGHDASKKTCLWLKNLPPLKETNRLPGDDKTRRSNQTPSGQNKLGPSKDRWKIRSTTYQGIADAMGEQWG